MKITTGTNDTIYEIDELDHPDSVRTDIVVTSVRVQNTHGRRDERVTIFNRGAMAGQIYVKSGDGAEIARRLLS